MELKKLAFFNVEYYNQSCCILIIEGFLMTLCAKFRKCETRLKLKGFSTIVKDKRNAYIHPNWNDIRNIAFILTLGVNNFEYWDNNEK